MVIFTQYMKVCKVFVKHNLTDLKVFHSRTTSPLFDGLLKLGRTVNYTKEYNQTKYKCTDLLLVVYGVTFMYTIGCLDR